MAFTTALYYPWIDLRRSEWTLNAILYWDQIKTIVPASIRAPYENRISRSLEAEGILLPLNISPNSPEVQLASSEFLAFAETSEGQKLLNGPLFMPRQSRDRFWERESYIHLEKLGDELYRWLLINGAIEQQESWIRIDRNIANYYLTILAGKLAQNQGVALLTASNQYEKLANMVYRDYNPQSALQIPQEYREVLLSYATLPVIGIQNNTPIDKIIDFRNKHRDEISRFRVEIARLSSEMRSDYPSMEALYQAVYDVYINHVLPARNDLEASMRGRGIVGYLTDLQTIMVGTSTFIVSDKMFEPLFAQNAPIAAVLTTGLVSVGVELVKRRIDKEKELRNNPFSFILQAQRAFSTK